MTQPPHALLTPRETEVVSLVVAGLSAKQIATRLVLSPRTVDNHVSRVRTKLELPNRAALVAYAVEHNLVPDREPAPEPVRPPVNLDALAAAAAALAPEKVLPHEPEEARPPSARWRPRVATPAHSPVLDPPLEHDPDDGLELDDTGLLLPVPPLPPAPADVDPDTAAAVGLPLRPRRHGPTVLDTEPPETDEPEQPEEVVVVARRRRAPVVGALTVLVLAVLAAVVFGDPADVTATVTGPVTGPAPGPAAPPATLVTSPPATPGSPAARKTTTPTRRPTRSAPARARTTPARPTTTATGTADADLAELRDVVGRVADQARRDERHRHDDAR